MAVHAWGLWATWGEAEMSPEQLLTRANAVRARYGWPLLTLADVLRRLA